MVGWSVGIARAGVFAQDDACPIQGAEQQPLRLCVLTLGTFDLNRPPLLPSRTRSQHGDQADGEHGRQQSSAARGVALALHDLLLLKLGRIQSIDSRPCWT